MLVIVIKKFSKWLQNFVCLVVGIVNKLSRVVVY